ncbi:MAG TPA: glycosyltransferase family 39 protein [Chthoniobacterales bacterium]|nr:glycosyltransferase family 39 protein [Chthoniobacterales bacterium]
MNCVLVETVGASLRAARAKRGWPITAAAIILAVVLGWLSLEIPKGTLVATDELLTAERTREMLSTGPWLVHFNFEPSFEKPPLQYWLTSLTLPRFENPSSAVRIWALIYAALTVVVLACLVLAIEPDRLWLVPLSVAVLFSCPLFATQATRGLLDVGLAFFTTTTILFSELARKRPAWWLAVAASCWLGSLQKNPLPFVICLLILAVRASSRGERPRLKSWWLAFSLLLAAVFIAAWPLLQLIKYHMPWRSVFHEEVIVWLGPTGLGTRPYLEIPIRMIINGGLCGLLALLAPFAVLFSRKETLSPAIRELALISVIAIALGIVSNLRHVRYVVPIVPVLCLLIAFVFYWLLKRTRQVRVLTIVSLVVLLVAGLVETKVEIDHLEGKDDRNDRINALIPALVIPKDVSDEKMIAEKLGALQGEGTKIVLVKAIKPGADLLWDSFYLFHGKLGSPVTKYTVDEIRANPPQPPIVGACVSRDLPVLQQLYPNLRVDLARAQFICWEVAVQ